MEMSNKLSIAAVVLSTTLGAPPALALTGGEFLDKLDGKYQTGYLIGAVDMAAHLFSVYGQRQKGECIEDWFSGKDRMKAQIEINAVFDANRDRDTIGLLHILFNRKCGE